MIDAEIENLERKGTIEFSEEYLIGKLINVLDDDEAGGKMISVLSQDMTNKSFSTYFGGDILSYAISVDEVIYGEDTR